MSVFSNPIHRSRDEAQAYVAGILELLGDRDAHGVLESLPASVESAVQGLDDDALCRPEAVGKWSILDVVQHLADSDLVWAYRLRTVVAEDGAPLTGYDQDVWARQLRYADRRLDDALDQLRSLRRINLRFLRSLRPDELTRTGEHSERGRESVAHMIRLYAGHDLVHLRQIERIRSAVS